MKRYLISKYIFAIIILFLSVSFCIAQKDSSFCFSSTSSSISIDTINNTIKWSSECYDSFSLEKYHWNCWRKISQVKGDKKDSLYYFSYDIKNIKEAYLFRLIDTLKESHRIVVAPLEKKRNPNGWPTKVNDVLSFPKYSNYIIFNAEGKEVLEGEGINVEVSMLEPGVYYLNLNNKITQFIKRVSKGSVPK